MNSASRLSSRVYRWVRYGGLALIVVFVNNACADDGPESNEKSVGTVRANGAPILRIATDDEDTGAGPTVTDAPNRVASTTKLFDSNQGDAPSAIETPNENGGSDVIARSGPARPARGAIQKGPLTAPSSGGLFEMMWPLAVVLLVVGFLAWAAKRWLPQSTGTSGGGALRIIARQALSSRQSLCLIRVGRRLVLAGVTPERITALTEFLDADESAEIVALVEKSRTGSFSSLFDSASRATLDDASVMEEETAIVETQHDALMPAGDLAHARANVCSLLSRVRALSSQFQSSAEPARRTAAGR